MEYFDIVLGCSFGDEGKGKVVYDLLTKNNYNLCVRFNGGSNAGHTVYINNEKYVVHQLPIGVLIPSVYNLISSDAVLDIVKLREEIQQLNSKGIDISGRLFVSKACHIITETAIEFDKQNNLVGTTGSGIGYTYSQKMLRTGKRAEEYKVELAQLGIEVVDMRKFWKSQLVSKNVYKVLVEGAQGFELDINWTNNYPFCTSSNCTLSGAINIGIPLRKIRNIYGISKMYDTYVGTMKFEPDNDPVLQKIGELGKEFGSTTGRKRQCNYLNLDNLIDALTINQCNKCIINKTDIVELVGVFQLYHNQQLVQFKSMEQMKSYIVSKLPFIDIVFSGNPNTI
jgi:adenylosuccinate synthase